MTCTVGFATHFSFNHIRQKAPIVGGLKLGFVTHLVFTARRYASAVFAVILCLSVSLSVTNRCTTKMVKLRITQTMPYDSQDYSFLVPKMSAKFQRGHPQWGRQIEVVKVISGDFRSYLTTS